MLPTTEGLEDTKETEPYSWRCKQHDKKQWTQVGTCEVLVQYSNVVFFNHKFDEILEEVA